MLSLASKPELAEMGRRLRSQTSRAGFRAATIVVLHFVFDLTGRRPV